MNQLAQALMNTQENMALVRELNQLRRELRSAQDGKSKISVIPALTPKTAASTNQLPAPPSPTNSKALTTIPKRSPGQPGSQARRISSAAHWKLAGPMVITESEGVAAESAAKAEVETLKARVLDLQKQLQERWAETPQRKCVCVCVCVRVRACVHARGGERERERGGGKGGGGGGAPLHLRSEASLFHTDTCSVSLKRTWTGCIAWLQFCVQMQLYSPDMLACWSQSLNTLSCQAAAMTNDWVWVKPFHCPASRCLLSRSPWECHDSDVSRHASID